jgi:hypothetical protein
MSGYDVADIGLGRLTDAPRCAVIILSHRPDFHVAPQKEIWSLVNDGGTGA